MNPDDGASGTEAPRTVLHRIVDRVFPGMGWRPLGLSLLALTCLVLYYHEGSHHAAPAWFTSRSASWTGLGAADFHRHAWSHAVAVVLLLCVPLVTCRATLRMRPRDLGLSIRGARRELLLCLGLWLASVPFVWIASRTAAFAASYPRVAEVRDDAVLFVAFHAFYLVKWTAWEFFFRGFMLFAFARDFGTRAVLISTIPFTLMHHGKPELEMLSAIVGGLVLCWIAWRSRSIWPGVLLHAAVAATMDFFASGWWR